MSRTFYFAGVRNNSHWRISRPWFAQDVIWHVAEFVTWGDFHAMVSQLRAENPDAIIGHYFSSCTASPSHGGKSPDLRLLDSAVHESWWLRGVNGDRVQWPGQAGRYYLDMRIGEARHAIISSAVSAAIRFGFNAVSFDNCYFRYGMAPAKDDIVSSADWTDAFLDFYAEAGEACGERGLRCLCNVATKAGDIPDMVDAVTEHVDGVMNEIPCHPNVIANATALTAEMSAYKRASAAGKIVLLMQANKDRSQATFDIIAPVARTHEHIYLSTPDAMTRHAGDWAREVRQQLTTP